MLACHHWTLEPITLKEANLYSFTADNYNGVDTVDAMREARNFIEKMGVIKIGNHINQAAYGDSDYCGYNTLISSNIWYFRGHGGRSYLIFKDAYGTKTKLTAQMISALPGNSLRNMYLFATNCCLAGDSVVNNSGTSIDLLGIVYRKGAHFAFATPNVSHTPQNNLWVEVFMGALADGKSYYNAIQDADAKVMSEYENSFEAMKTCARHYAGDSSIVLYHPTHE